MRVFPYNAACINIKSLMYENENYAYDKSLVAMQRLCPPANVKNIHKLERIKPLQISTRFE